DCSTRAFDARNLPHAFVKLAEKCFALLRFRIAGIGELNRIGDHAARIEPWIDVFEFREALKQKTRARKQNHGERQLCGNEDAAQPFLPPALPRSAPGFLE